MSCDFLYFSSDVNLFKQSIPAIEQSSNRAIEQSSNRAIEQILPRAFFVSTYLFNCITKNSIVNLFVIEDFGDILFQLKLLYPIKNKFFSLLVLDRLWIMKSFIEIKKRMQKKI